MQGESQRGASSASTTSLLLKSTHNLKMITVEEPFIDLGGVQECQCGHFKHMSLKHLLYVNWIVVIRH